MVRINLISPKRLTDQHLIAEYNEILMLLGYVKKHPHLDLQKIPKRYLLGPGHILFFKNKLNYLQERFNLLKKEMQVRGYSPQKELSLNCFPKCLCCNWQPQSEDEKVIVKRLIHKIKLKPNYYTYYGKKHPEKFLIQLVKDNKRIKNKK